MIQSIEFTTSANLHHPRIPRGIPLHNGEIPLATSDPIVRLNGEVVTFADESLPTRLHRALVIGKQGAERGLPFNCIVFAALVQNLAIPKPNQNPFLPVDFDSNASDAVQATTPLVLGVVKADSNFDIMISRHVVVPAPQQTSVYPSYLHKLGDGGPVCLSGLRQAMDIYDCAVAHPPESKQ